MRRLALAFLASVALIAGCQQAPPAYVSRYTEPPAEPPVAAVSAVAIIGDSYTKGSPMGGHGAAGWPALVTAQLSRQGVDIRPAIGAEGGSGYVKPNSKTTVFADQIPRVVKPNDRLVVLFGSLNDGSVPADQLTAAVQRTLAEANVAAPEGRLLVIGPAWPDANPPARILRVRDILRDQAELAEATFVDPIAEGWFADRPDLIGADGVHPTDAGHQYLADKIAPLMTLQLQAPPLPH